MFYEMVFWGGFLFMERLRAQAFKSITQILRFGMRTFLVIRKEVDEFQDVNLQPNTFLDFIG